MRHAAALAPVKFDSTPYAGAEKDALVASLIKAKEATGKTFTQISKEVGLTNTQTAQLFYNQAQLKPGRVEALKKAVPELTEEQLSVMQKCPFRTFDPQIKQVCYLPKNQIYDLASYQFCIPEGNFSLSMPMR